MTVSIAMQVIGVLLVFALLVGPPATAIRLVHRPAPSWSLSIMSGAGLHLAGNFAGRQQFLAGELFHHCTSLWCIPAGALIVELWEDGQIASVERLSSFCLRRISKRLSTWIKNKPGPIFIQLKEKHHA